MKVTVPTLVAGTFLLLAVQVFAQESGTSHPESLNDTVVVATPQSAVVTVTTPDPALRTHTTTPAQTETYEAYKPYRPAGAPESRPAERDPDAGIVTTFPYSDNALSAGTLLKAHLVGTLSTETTRQGSHFVATLSQNIEHNGKVIIPIGASLEGRVTQVRSGSRISGGAAIHLEPETISLPDGTLYHLNARVTDLDSGRGAHVNDEGTIVGGNHTKGHVATLAATTGGGAVTGAVLGGGVGAAVGAGIGAGVGTVLWLKQDRQQTLLEGTELVFTLNHPMELVPANRAATN